MPEQFLHGIEIVEVDDSIRAIETVKSNVIGIVGTAPDSAPSLAAFLQVGVASSNNAMKFEAVTAGQAGNNISVRLANPVTADASLSVAVTGLNITINLATNAAKAVTSTVTQVIAAITSNALASALISVSNVAGSDGSGAAQAMTKLTNLVSGADEAFPLNTPVIVFGSRKKAAKLDTTGEKKGTLPDAMDLIFDQIGAQVVVIRVAEGADADETKSNVIGGVNANSEYTGVHALLGANASVHVKPRILIAPGFTGDLAVATEMIGIAERISAVVYADVSELTDAAAVAYRQNFGSKRIFLIEPDVKAWDTASNSEVILPASSTAAGLTAKTDQKEGFWHSPSNRIINGIIGTSRTIDFSISDPNSRANYLNENEVATIVREDGYRLWGNRTCSSDPKWAFLSVVRTADMINESLLEAHLWAVDKNITKTYFEQVSEGVNAYLRHLTAVGAILGGKCYVDPELNTPDQAMQGKVYFDIEFTPAYPAEHVTFRSHLVNDYFTEVLAA